MRRIIKKGGHVTAMLVLAVFLSGCVADQEYRGAQYPPITVFPSGGPPITRAAISTNIDLQHELTNYCIESFKPELGHQTNINIGIVEMRDDGKEWNPSQANEVLQMIDDTVTANKGAVIVTFIHGWENNAKVTNGNLSCFRLVLEELSQNGVTGNYPVVGVYVGWRGESCSVPWLQPFTVWNRKSAAEHIGTNACLTFLKRLDGEYQKLNRNPDNQVIMVTIGHSFGGQMLFSAVQDKMLDLGTSPDPALRTLIEAEPVSSNIKAPDRSVSMAEMTMPVTQPATRSGFGDLCVLVNPALEARLYQPFDLDMKKVGQYATNQSVLLAAYASKADWAVGVLFPIAEFIAAFRHPSHFMEGTSEFFGLGHYCPQVTHMMDYTGPTNFPVVAACGCPTLSNEVPPQRLMNLELVERIRPNPAIPDSSKTKLWPDWDADQAPFAVVRTTSRVMDDHNNIFNPIMVSQISKMISQTYQAKKDLRLMAHLPVK